VSRDAAAAVAANNDGVNDDDAAARRCGLTLSPLDSGEESGDNDGSRWVYKQDDAPAKKVPFRAPPRALREPRADNDGRPRCRCSSLLRATYGPTLERAA